SAGTICQERALQLEKQETKKPKGERSRAPTSIISIPVRDFFQMTQLKRSGGTRTEGVLLTKHSGAGFREEKGHPWRAAAEYRR
ncbi:hypothetical protein K0M31_000128, partial [Melipona bicolor]